MTDDPADAPQTGVVMQHTMAYKAGMESAACWQPWETAPKDGQWFIALMNDWRSMRLVGWGRNQYGDLCWCGDDASYGDGLFCAWVPWPDGGPTLHRLAEGVGQ